MSRTRISIYKNLLFAALFAATLIAGLGNAHAALSFVDSHNFSGSGTDGGRDYFKLSGSGSPFVFTYNHNVTFIHPAASITYAQVVLSHNGNSNNSGEVWILEGVNKTRIGNLDRSTMGNSWVEQAFVIPAPLYSTISGGSWSLQLVLNENTSGTDELKIDQSVLSGTYIPTPIPAAAWLLGSGLLGLVVIRKKQK